MEGEKDQSGGKRLDLTHVPGGQWLEVRMRNEGLEDYWVTLLFAGADFSIDVWYSDSIRRGESFPPLRAPLDDATPGAEGFIVLAVPMRAEKNQPRFTILKQLALGEDDTGQLRAAPQTPFGELLNAAALGGGTRNSNADLDAATNPSISTWSWVTVPRNAVIGR